MVDKGQLGKIVWYEFISTDKEKAKRFYADLLGWTFETRDMGPGETYEMIKAGEKNIGGFAAPKGPNAGNVPPHWTAYVQVEDVRGTVERVNRLGGHVPVGPVEIPGVGSFGVSVDKEQAGISFFASAESSEEMGGTQDRPGMLEFCWTECMVDDVEAERAYYGELFGWSFANKDMGGEVDYWVAKSAETEVAGIMKKPPEHQGPSCWLSYVFVQDLETTIEKAKSLGGQAIAGPIPVPEVGRVAIVMDDQGALIGLFGDPVEP